MARNKRYIRINERIQDVYKILAALDDAAIEYEWLGHDKDISVIEINLGSMSKTYNDAVGGGYEYVRKEEKE